MTEYAFVCTAERPHGKFVAHARRHRHLATRVWKTLSSFVNASSFAWRFCTSLSSWMLKIHSEIGSQATGEYFLDAYFCLDMSWTDRDNNSRYAQMYLLSVIYGQSYMVSHIWSVIYGQSYTVSHIRSVIYGQSYYIHEHIPAYALEHLRRRP